jgi:hypothetical protein
MITITYLISILTFISYSIITPPDTYPT